MLACSRHLLAARAIGTEYPAGKFGCVMIDPQTRFSQLSSFAAVTAANSACAPQSAGAFPAQCGVGSTLAQIYALAREQAVASQRLKWHALLERLLR